MARAVATLEAVPQPPTIKVPGASTGPALAQGLPLWIFETNAWLLPRMVPAVLPPSNGARCLGL